MDIHVYILYIYIYIYIVVSRAGADVCVLWEARDGWVDWNDTTFGIVDKCIIINSKSEEKKKDFNKPFADCVSPKPDLFGIKFERWKLYSAYHENCLQKTQLTNRQSCSNSINYEEECRIRLKKIKFLPVLFTVHLIRNLFFFFFV